MIIEGSTAEYLALAIAKWIGKHANRESIFSTPNPQWNVNASELLDFINSETAIPKETLGEAAAEGHRESQESNGHQPHMSPDEVFQAIGIRLND